MWRTVLDHPASMLIDNSQDFAAWFEALDEGSIGVGECRP